MELKLKPTERGFLHAEFKDLYGKECSIQESSLATDDAIWLGCNEGKHHMGECLARMHLNREQVASLIPILQYFVKNGYLPENAAQQANGSDAESKALLTGEKSLN